MKDAQTGQARLVVYGGFDGKQIFGNTMVYSWGKAVMRVRCWNRCHATLSWMKRCLSARPPCLCPGAGDWTCEGCVDVESKQVPEERFGLACCQGGDDGDRCFVFGGVNMSQDLSDLVRLH